MCVVVVAEDEPLILMAIVDHLTEEGLQVLEAGHAEEALAILARASAYVDVLFTDVQMPGDMDGVALSHHVRAHWPWIGLLVTSAHLAPASEDLPAGCRFLRKPYYGAHVVDHIKDLTEAA
jgi:two-component system, response regulator PdtaR